MSNDRSRVNRKLLQWKGHSHSHDLLHQIGNAELETVCVSGLGLHCKDHHSDWREWLRKDIHPDCVEPALRMESPFRIDAVPVKAEKAAALQRVLEGKVEAGNKPHCHDPRGLR